MSSIRPDPSAELAPFRTWRTLAGLGVTAMTLGVSFVARGICWEAIAFATPLLILVAAIGRFRDIVLTAAVVLFLIVGLLVVEGVNLYSYHSVLLSTTPRMIRWCGQDLAPQGAPVEARSDSDFERLAGGGPVHMIGVTPEGSAVVAAGTNAAWGCAFQLYVALGSGRWQLYTQDPE
jgi:hypothetical protein